MHAADYGRPLLQAASLSSSILSWHATHRLALTRFPVQTVPLDICAAGVQSEGCQALVADLVRLHSQLLELTYLDKQKVNMLAAGTTCIVGECAAVTVSSETSGGTGG